MAVDLSHDIWTELKRYISTVDRSDAAESLVAVLIDNDYDAEHIRNVYKGDVDIKKALEFYIDDISEEESTDYDEDFEDD
jgi:hypothetical protein